jgi:hypothetical protein
VARTPPPGLIAIEDSPTGEPGIATLCGVKPGTIRKWRMRGWGPHTWRANGMVVSSPDAVAEYLDKLKHAPLQVA